MAAGTSTPVEAGQGPSVLSIAASIGAKIRDAAEDAKEQREKAAEKGETPKKGSLFKSALGNQFNPIKSKKAKSTWAKQFDWNKTSNNDQQVKPPSGAPSGEGGGDSKGKLKEFIAGGFTAILKDTGLMTSKLDGVKSLAGANLSEVTRSSSTLTVIKDSIDAQTELRKKALEEAKFARAEKQLEKTKDTAGVSKSQSADKEDEEGDGGGSGDKEGFDLFGTLLGGLEGVESIMQIRNMLMGGKAAAGAAGAAQTAGGIGAGAAAGIVGGAGLALSAGGEGMFQLGQMGDKSLKDRRKSIDEKKARGENTFLDEALQVGQTGVGEIGKTLGVAMDVGGAPFRYAIEALRNPFLSPEQKEEQAYNLAKMDTRIREHSRGWMNRIDFMNVIPDEKGGFGNIYGNEGAKNEMANKMSEGGIVDNPTETMLNPGDSVIPLNRNAGKEMFGKKAATSPEETAMDTVGAMILGVSAGMLGKTDSGTVGDQVKQNIRKASKLFGISNLTFTSSIGKGQFGAVDTQKDSKDFLMSLFDGMKISGSKGKEKGGGGGTPPTGSVAEAAKSMSGMSAQEADVRMDKMDKVLTDAGIPNAIMGTPGVAGDSVTEAWCAQFVATALGEKNYKPPNSALADAYAPGKWGETVDPKEAKAGDVITIDYSGTKKTADHVAIVTGNDGTTISYTGGNQGSTGSSLTNRVTDGTMKVTDPNLLGITRPKETLSSSSPQARDAQQTAQATNLSGATETASQMPDGNVTQVAQDGGSFNILNPFSWGKAMEAGDKARKGQGGYKKTLTGNMLNRNAALAEAMKASGMARGGNGNAASAARMKAYAAKLKSQKASDQRSRLGVQKVNGRYVNMGVSDQAVGKNPWWQIVNKKGATAERKQKQEALAKNLAERLNKEQGLNKPAPTPARRPTPARSPSQAGGTRPAPRPAASSGAIAVMPSAAPKAPSASAEGSFGSAVPAAKTSAMVFADFLYPDLV